MSLPDSICEASDNTDDEDGNDDLTMTIFTAALLIPLTSSVSSTEIRNQDVERIKALATVNRCRRQTGLG